MPRAMPETLRHLNDAIASGRLRWRDIASACDVSENTARSWVARRRLPRWHEERLSRALRSKR